ncbi:MAG: hypothetical protein K5894_13645 [Lachnospiraceae bacterium]|nr:hypothetical protein [Lachnospiraceae bacterium]
MSKKTTKDLENILENTHSSQMGKFLEENKGDLFKTENPFCEYFHSLIKERNIKQQDIFLAADITERYGYKLLSGEKHTRQRDVILRLCYAAGFSLKETQLALKAYGMPELYAKFPRDAMLMVAFNERPGSIIDVNQFLRQNGFDPLRSSGSQN